MTNNRTAGNSKDNNRTTGNLTAGSAKTAEMNPEFENKAIRNMSVVGIAGNIFLTAFKLFAGIFGHSGAMISDAIHSSSDVLATFIAFVGVKISQKGEDKEHEYGHERMECIAALILGGILFITGVFIGKTGIETIISGNYTAKPIPGTIALIAAIVSILCKEAMFWYTRHYAKILNSSAFMADAWHHRSDAFSSIGSLIGIAGAMLGYPVMDSLASVVICVFILKVAIDIFRDAFQKMMDTSCGEKYEEDICDFVISNSEVKSIDLIHTRMFGSKVYIDLEISMDGNKSLTEAHDIATEVHNGIEEKFPEVKHVMIHVNPA